MNQFLSCFKVMKPVIGVIHTKGTDDADMLRRAKEEIRIYKENGVDSFLVETYFGTYYQVEKVLDYVAGADLGMPYGVNCLNVDAMGFELAMKFDCDYLQLDSVVGHVKPRDEDSLDAFFKLYRERCKAYVIGGVRFKYQPVLSDRTVEEDLKIAMTRCDAICVTQDATGQETSTDKIVQFRNGIGDFPLIIGAGLTPQNVAEKLALGDGAIVGSFFKDNYQDNGDVCPAHVAEMMDAVRRFREKL